MEICEWKSLDDGSFQCVRCEKIKTKATRRNCPIHRGLGDIVASFIKKTLRIKPCSPCEKRRRALNKIRLNRRDELTPEDSED